MRSNALFHLTRDKHHGRYHYTIFKGAPGLGCTLRLYTDSFLSAQEDFTTQ